MSDDFFPISLDDQIACVERELALRRRVYPHQIAQARLTPERARREIARMEAVLATLQRVKSPPSRR